MKKKSRHVQALLYAFLTAWLLFASFGLLSIWLGGTALDGKVEGGRYFLGYHPRGRPTTYRETTRAVFLYSRIHGIVAIAGFGAVMVWGVGGFLIIPRVRAAFSHPDPKR